MSSHGTHRDEFPLLLGFFREAIASALRNPRTLLFALLTVLFGTDVLSAFPTLSDRLQIFLVGIEAGNIRPFAIFLFFSGAILLSALSTLSRTGLLLSVGERPLSIRRLPERSVRVFIPLFLLEIGTWISIFLLALLLLAPSEAAKGAELSGMLGMVGGMIFLFVTVIILFTRTFAFFHIVFSEVSLSSALRLGYALFRKHTRKSLLFALISGGITLLASLLIRITTALSAFFFVGSDDTTSRIVAALLVLTAHSAIQKWAWVSFFRHLSKPENPQEAGEASQESEKVLQREVPETGKA